MAQASKMGADTTTREARRALPSGHQCIRCGGMISFGELLMIQSVVMDERGRATRKKVPYHRKCYGLS